MGTTVIAFYQKLIDFSVEKLRCYLVKNMGVPIFCMMRMFHASGTWYSCRRFSLA
jgi:hypothetical protein